MNFFIAACMGPSDGFLGFLCSVFAVFGFLGFTALGLPADFSLGPLLCLQAFHPLVGLALRQGQC